jgi:8-oxo-dGTP pyrophosphatase MutT (NUDIX family)
MDAGRQSRERGKPPPPFLTKASYGVIITRRNPLTRRLEAVTVRSRYSYEYADFVYGRYNPRDHSAVMALLNNMSVNERLLIKSLDFHMMWHMIWLTTMIETLYQEKYRRFVAAWCHSPEAKERLQTMIANSEPPKGSESGSNLEFPKGRKASARESALACAIRETMEETGVPKDRYNIVPGFVRQMSFVHMGVRYIHVYFVAFTSQQFDVGVDFRNAGQVAEVADVRWLDIEGVRRHDTPDKRLERTVEPVFRYVKKFLRGRAGRPVRGD